MKPTLAILQAHQERALADSPSAAAHFQCVCAREAIPLETDYIYTAHYTSRPVLKLLRGTDRPYVVHMQGDPWRQGLAAGRMRAVEEALHRAHGIIAISDHLARSVREHLPKVPIEVLPGFWGCDHTPLGIVPQFFRPRAAHGAVRLVLMQMHQTHPLKPLGIPQFFEAIAPWRAHNLDTQFLCIGNLGGSGRWRKWAAEYDCEFRETLPRPAWADLLRTADIYAHPSLCDTWGRSIAEAMCCGVPVVAFCTGGIPEISDRLLLASPDEPRDILTQWAKCTDLFFRAQFGPELRAEALKKTEQHRCAYADALVRCLNPP